MHLARGAKIWRAVVRGKCGEMGGACGRNKAWRHCKFSTEKMGCLGGGFLSLSLSRYSHLWHAFALNLKGFFTHFVVDFAHFIAISSHLIVNFSYFIVVLTHLFTYKRHFLEHCAFLKFLNALFLGFLCLSLRAVFAKTAWQSINLALFLLFGLPRSLCSLAMTARHKFKFFTQNSKYFINSTHFINLSQNLSHTQGFFIFLSQVFAQFLLINSTQRSSYGRQGTKAPF